jgi:hypothetical protein
VAVTTDDQGPVPATFTAAVLKEYKTPAVRDVTDADVVVETPSVKVLQVAPASLEYWTV